MVRVLRGGKWGNVSRGNSSHTGPPDDDADGDILDVEEEARNQDTGTVVCFFEEKQQLGVACYDLAANEMYLSKCSTEGEYLSATQVVSSLDVCAIVLPRSYSYNTDLLKAIRACAPNGGPSPATQRTQSRTSGSANKEARRSYGSASQSRSNASCQSAPRDADISRQSTADDPSEDSDNLVSYIPNSEFSLKKSLELCGIINVRGMPAGLTPHEKLAFLSHILGDEGYVTRAVGGLLSFVQQNGILGTITNQNESVELNAIGFRNFCNAMKISPTTLHALHVFSDDTHPMGRGTMKGKEGLSLYSLLKGKAKTVAARKLLRTWLMYPSTSEDVITARQTVVEVLRKSSNSALLRNLKDALKGVKNVPGVLCRFRKNTAGVNDWKALYFSIKSFLIIQDTLRIALQQNQDLSQSPLLQDSLNVRDEELRLCINWMDAVVDFEESTAVGRMVVADGFSEEIDEMKRNYSGLDDFLTNLGIDECKRFQDSDDGITLRSLQFTYLPQVGYLIAIPASDCDRIGMDNLEKTGFAYIFSSSDGEYHFKNDRCRKLDDEPGDIHAAILDKEEKAFRLLEKQILSYAVSLFCMAKLTCQLDCLQAMAHCANEYSWCKPILSMEAQDLEIESGRHPLVELVVPSFVPNNTNLKFGDLHVLTGPNYSGKSVYLAHTALIVILAQIGSCVPAKRAKIPIFESLNTRIASLESVTYGQSSFFLDACQVSRMCSASRGKTLNLIDEYGKGTSESDGMALLAATLQSFLNAAITEAPICICATHFVEILKEPFLPMGSARVSVSSMEVISRPLKGGALSEGSSLAPNLSTGLASTGHASVGSRPGGGASTAKAGTNSVNEQAEPFGQVVRTYRLQQGLICGESRAMQCAAEAGVPKFILQHAAHVREVISGTGSIQDVIVSKDRNERIRTCLDSVRTLLSTNLEDVQEDSKSLVEKVLKL